MNNLDKKFYLTCIISIILLCIFVYCIEESKKNDPINKLTEWVKVQDSITDAKIKHIRARQKSVDSLLIHHDDAFKQSILEDKKRAEAERDSLEIELKKAKELQEYYKNKK